MTKAAVNEGRYRLDRFGQWAGIPNTRDQWGVVGVWVLKGKQQKLRLGEEEGKVLLLVPSVQPNYPEVKAGDRHIQV